MVALPLLTKSVHTPSIRTFVRLWPEPYIYSVYSVVLARKSPDTPSYTVYTYGSGEPYTLVRLWPETYLSTKYGVYIYGIFGRKITKYTVIYGVYTRFWPTLHF